MEGRDRDGGEGKEEEGVGERKGEKRSKGKKGGRRGRGQESKSARYICQPQGSKVQ